MKPFYYIVIICSVFFSCKETPKYYAHLIGTWEGTYLIDKYENDSLISYFINNDVKLTFDTDQTGQIEYQVGNIQDFIWIYLPEEQKMNLLLESTTSFGHSISNREYEILIDDIEKQQWQSKSTSMNPDSIEILSISEWMLEKEE